MIKVSLNSYRPEIIPFLESINRVEFRLSYYRVIVLKKINSEILDCIACGENEEGFMFSNDDDYKIAICPKCGFVQGLIIGGS